MNPLGHVADDAVGLAGTVVVDGYTVAEDLQGADGSANEVWRGLERTGSHRYRTPGRDQPAQCSRPDVSA